MQKRPNFLHVALHTAFFLVPPRRQEKFGAKEETNKPSKDQLGRNSSFLSPHEKLQEKSSRGIH